MIKKRKRFFFHPKLQNIRISKWLIIPIVIFVLFFLIPRLIRINSINCQSQFGQCSSTISSKIIEIQQTNYLNTKNELNNFLKNNYLVSDYTIKFNFPNILIASIVEKKPVVSFVKRSDENKFYYIDAQGLVLFIQQSSQLPKIIISEDINLESGQKVNEELLFASKILQGSFITFGSRLAEVTPDLIEVDLPSSIKVRFPLRGDTNLLLGSLNVILSRLNMQSTDSKIKLIDLRFKNPVIY